MKTLIYIDSNLTPRYSEKGWPEKPFDMHNDSNREWNIYNEALEKAKAESIEFEELDSDRVRIQIPVPSIKPDTFVEVEIGEVEVCVQRRLRGVDKWIDGPPPSESHAKAYSYEFRKIARVKQSVTLSDPGVSDYYNSANSYTKGVDVIGMDDTEELTENQSKVADMIINTLMQKWHMPIKQARDVGRDLFFGFVINRKYEPELFAVKQQLDAANERIKELESLTKLEGYTSTGYEDNRYEFNLQVWGAGNNNIYISKGDVEMWSGGGYDTANDAIKAALEYLKRVNAKTKK